MQVLSGKILSVLSGRISHNLCARMCFEVVLGENALIITVVPSRAVCNDFTLLFSGTGNYWQAAKVLVDSMLNFRVDQQMTFIKTTDF